MGTSRARERVTEADERLSAPPRLRRTGKSRHLPWDVAFRPPRPWRRGGERRENIHPLGSWRGMPMDGGAWIVSAAACAPHESKTNGEVFEQSASDEHVRIELHL